MCLVKCHATSHTSQLSIYTHTHTQAAGQQPSTTRYVLYPSWAGLVLSCVVGCCGTRAWLKFPFAVSSLFSRTPSLPTGYRKAGWLIGWLADWLADWLLANTTQIMILFPFSLHCHDSIVLPSYLTFCANGAWIWRTTRTTRTRTGTRPIRTGATRITRTKKRRGREEEANYIIASIDILVLLLSSIFFSCCLCIKLFVIVIITSNLIFVPRVLLSVIFIIITIIIIIITAIDFIICYKA